MIYENTRQMPGIAMFVLSSSGISFEWQCHREYAVELYSDPVFAALVCIVRYYSTEGVGIDPYVQWILIYRNGLLQRAP